MRTGLYIAVFRLARPRRIAVGRLGRFAFDAGIYLYVGSAQRNLPARLARHARSDKPLRWHLDYLGQYARMLGALLIPGGRQRECALAEQLAARYHRRPSQFGSSDCRCGGHLFYATSLDELAT